MSSTHIFVYGTLRKRIDHPKHRILDDHAEFVGKATCGGRLYLIDWYPGLVEAEGSQNRVIGELYHILYNTSEVLKKIDLYEGCAPDSPGPHEYRREKKTVTLNDKAQQIAWVYVYLGDTKVNP